jgi:hypothetical protein
LDSLITQGYLRSYEDDEGTTQLLQFDEMSPEEVDRALARVLESIEKYEEEASEEDDTP